MVGYLGLRWAEAVGLQRHNTYLLKRRVLIEWTLREVDGEFHRVPPETDEERDVVLPVFLADELAAHIGRYGEDDPAALVFTSPEGNPIRNSNFRRRAWPPSTRNRRRRQKHDALTKPKEPRKPLPGMVVRGRIELPTSGFSDQRSTD